MGLPEDYDHMADNGGKVRHSYASQSSDDSLILSGSSKESSAGASASSQSQTSDPVPLHRSNPNPHRTRNQNPHCTTATHFHCEQCADWDNLGERDKTLRVVTAACRYPDSISWKIQTNTVKLERNAKGSLGFSFKDMEGEISGKMYTMVRMVVRDGPAHGKLSVGDCILSANKIPLDYMYSQGITLASVISINKTEPVILITQSPASFNCHPKINRARRVARSISQEREAKQSAGVNIGKMPPHSPHASKTSNAIVLKSIDERHQALANSGNLSRLDTLMPRLPFMSVLISGCEADQLATSLLGGASKTDPSENDVGVCYRASVKKTSSGFSLDASHADCKEWIIDLLESVADERNLKPSALSNQVELEITALKSDQFSTYCQHILATAHSIFIIQFCCQDFLDDKQSVLLDIQRRLNKICTYASNRAHVYLVMTVEDSLPVEQLSAIGQSLHRRFAFMNQLQYNAVTNCPCFQVVRTLPGQQLDNHCKPFRDLSCQVGSDCSSDSEECHIVSSKDSGSLGVCYSVRSDTTRSTINPKDREFDVSELQDYISVAAFEQKFITDRYPFRYLLHRERIQQLKKNGLHYVYKANIMQECTGIISEKELSGLLHFLHNSGDIICADFLEFWDSSNTLPLKIASNNILLGRQHLITATKQLTTIPSLSEQQDPWLHNSIQNWDDLRSKCMASASFLEHLLGNDLESTNLLTTLSQMNIIHYLPPLDSPSAATFLVPFFLPHNQPHLRQSSSFPYDPRLYNLCVDFHGSIPDGFFMQMLFRLVRKAWETHGWWKIDSPWAACLSLANTCEINVVCDEAESMIKISARCRVTYNVQELLLLITNIVDDLKSIKSGLRITVGPPCPLPPYKCRVQVREPGRTHVIDIARGRAQVPLWCGDQQIDEMPAFDHWLIKTADIQVALGPNHHCIQVSQGTHIKHLPPKLFNWLCNQLNMPPVGRDWQGLANALGYKVNKVKVFEMQRSPYDPCSSLLLDWGRMANATLGALVNILERDLERMDILTDLRQEWSIVE